MNTQSRRITRQKIALIHVAVQKLGMPEEDYRALLMGAAGVSSASDLDTAGFHAVMLRFEAPGFTSTGPKAPQYGERLGMATNAQVRNIRAQWKAWQGSAEDAESAHALRRWIERCYGVSDLRFCDVTTAQKALEGLKAMNARKRRAAASTSATQSTKGQP